MTKSEIEAMDRSLRLAEAERALDESPKLARGSMGTSGLPAPNDEAAASTTIKRLCDLIHLDNVAVCGLGGHDDHARVWRMIAAIALHQSATWQAAANRTQK